MFTTKGLAVWFAAIAVAWAFNNPLVFLAIVIAYMVGLTDKGRA